MEAPDWSTTPRRSRCQTERSSTESTDGVGDLHLKSASLRATVRSFPNDRKQSKNNPNHITRATVRGVEALFARLRENPNARPKNNSLARCRAAPRHRTTAWSRRTRRSRRSSTRWRGAAGARATCSARSARSPRRSRRSTRSTGRKRATRLE